MKFTGSLVAWAMAVGLALAPAGSRAGGPTVTWASVKSYDLAASGAGWAESDYVGFELSTSGWTYGLILRADPEGAFEIGIKHFSCSQGGTGQAHDLAGDSAMAPVMDPCGPHGIAQTPSFSVLKGRSVNPSVKNVAGVGNGKVVRFPQGGELSLWEKGTKNPSIVPTAPPKHFFLLGYRRGRNPACRGTSCPKGFIWAWLGVAPGSTAITLQPWCDGQVCPQEWVAELRVHITATKA